MICEYCAELSKKKDSQKKNLASAVMVEVNTKECLKFNRSIYSPSMAGCEEGSINPIYLDNFRNLLSQSI